MDSSPTESVAPAQTTDSPYVGKWNQQFEMMSDDETDEDKRQRNLELRRRMTGANQITLELKNDLTFRMPTLGFVATGTWESDGPTVSLQFDVPGPGEMLNAGSFRGGAPMVLEFDEESGLLTCVDIDDYEYFFARMDE